MSVRRLKRQMNQFPSQWEQFKSFRLFLFRNLKNPDGFAVGLKSALRSQRQLVIRHCEAVNETASLHPVKTISGIQEKYNSGNGQQNLHGKFFPVQNPYCQNEDNPQKNDGGRRQKLLEIPEEKRKFRNGTIQGKTCRTAGKTTPQKIDFSENAVITSCQQPAGQTAERNFRQVRIEKCTFRILQENKNSGCKQKYQPEGPDSASFPFVQNTCQHSQGKEKQSRTQPQNGKKFIFPVFKERILRIT